jgi:hypothetical protein
MRKLIIGVLLILLLTGSAVYAGLADPLIATQVKAALMQSGVGDKRAACMADRMVDRLTVVQLYHLRQGMAPQPGEPENADGLGELVKRLSRVEDGEAVAVLTTSAGLCAIGIG